MINILFENEVLNTSATNTNSWGQKNKLADGCFSALQQLHSVCRQTKTKLNCQSHMLDFEISYEWPNFSILFVRENVFFSDFLCKHQKLANEIFGGKCSTLFASTNFQIVRYAFSKPKEKQKNISPFNVYII